ARSACILACALPSAACGAEPPLVRAGLSTVLPCFVVGCAHGLRPSGSPQPEGSPSRTVPPERARRSRQEAGSAYTVLGRTTFLTGTRPVRRGRPGRVGCQTARWHLRLPSWSGG